MAHFTLQDPEEKFLVTFYNQQLNSIYFILKVILFYYVCSMLYYFSNILLLTLFLSVSPFMRAKDLSCLFHECGVKVRPAVSFLSFASPSRNILSQSRPDLI